MLDSIRKRQRSLLLIITVITIIAFAWWYNPGRAGREAAGELGKINGRTVTIQDVQKLERNIQLAAELGMADLPNQLVTAGRSRDEQGVSFAWNVLLLRDEATRLQIEPTTDQIKAAEKALALFQTNDQFDPSKYQNFVDQGLQPAGLSAADLDEVVADHLRLEGVKQLLKGGNQYPEAMFREQYERVNARMHLAVIRLRREDFEKDIQITDEDIKKYYDQHKDSLRSQEKRSVQIVSFALTDAQKSLAEDKKNEALKPLAEQAEAFMQPVLEHPGEFEKTAEQKGLKIQETGLFAQSSPDPLIHGEPALVRQVFSLTKENPVSDIVQGTNGFFVVKLKEIEPSRPLSLEEAEERITTTLKGERVQAAMEAKSKEILAKINAESGLDFVQAAEKVGFKPELPEPFSFADPGPNSALMQTIAANELDLDPGDRSKLLQGQDGGLIIHLISKDPVDEKKYQEDRKTEYAAANEQFETIMFREWLKVEEQKAGRPPV